MDEVVSFRGFREEILEEAAGFQRGGAAGALCACAGVEAGLRRSGIKQEGGGAGYVEGKLVAGRPVQEQVPRVGVGGRGGRGCGAGPGTGMWGGPWEGAVSFHLPSCR